MGGKTRTDANGKVAKGWDHDPPAKEKLVPFGIVMRVTGALMLLFGSHETSDAWVDALQMWWLQVRSGFGHVKRLVIYLDNGPKNSGRRTQFLKRMVQFADWSGLEIRLVYYPPYHSKYNPIERCWSALEKKWNVSWKTKILNYFDARQTSAAVEGINNKARVITKRTYGLKSAKSLWDRLILDLNRASQAIGYSIEHIRQMAKGLKALFDWSCT